MGFRICGKTGAPPIINSLDDWQRLAPPKQVIHWQSGRSAMELAKAWFRGGKPRIPQEIDKLLRSHTHTKDIVFLQAYAELETNFDDTTSGPRNHDLFIEAKIGEKYFFIGIEAKEREKFDDTIENKIAVAKERSERTKLPERINEFCLGLLGRPYYDDLKKCGYQLFSGAAGTLVEAERRGSTETAFIIHQFQSKVSPVRDIERNVRDYKSFLNLFLKKDETFQDGKLYGPFEVPGSRLIPSGSLYIGKVTTRI